MWLNFLTHFEFSASSSASHIFSTQLKSSSLPSPRNLVFIQFCSNDPHYSSLLNFYHVFSHFHIFWVLCDVENGNRRCRGGERRRKFHSSFRIIWKSCWVRSKKISPSRSRRNFPHSISFENFKSMSSI